MSAQQFFSETEAVIQVLSEYVDKHSDQLANDGRTTGPDEEQFTAVWQAIELLDRARTVLIPMIQLDMNKYALNIPDPKVEQSKAARLYDGQGRPIA